MNFVQIKNILCRKYGQAVTLRVTMGTVLLRLTVPAGDSDIPMVSVDICNEDIQFMQEGKNWKACATTNWTSNGEFACRVLALEMADQYEDIEAASCYYADPGAWMEIPSVIVTQEMVTSKDGINIENLAEVAGEDYSDTSWMPTCDWMVSALGH